jgi:hypothetical protein
MTFWVDPDPDPRIHASDQWIRIRILDPDPGIFVINLQDVSKKLILEHNFFLLLFEATFTSFFKEKKSKRVTKY